MGRKIFAVSTVLVVLTMAIVPVSIAHAEPSPDAKPELVRTLIQLHGAAPLDDAVALGPDLDGEVIGYRYENNGLVGEFYPSSAYSNAQFLADFSAKYSSSPRVIALVTEFETAE